MKTIFTTGLFTFFLLIANISFAQVSSDDKIEEKKKIKVQLWSNGKPLLPNQLLGKNEIEIGVKVFPFDAKENKEDKKLVVTDFDVLLIHNGKKIAEQNVTGVVGSIANLAELAHNDDTYAIKINEVYEVTKEGNLITYAKGKILMNYLFFDPKLAIRASKR